MDHLRRRRPPRIGPRNQDAARRGDLPQGLAEGAGEAEGLNETEIFMNVKIEEHTIGRALGHAAIVERNLLLDSLACYLHNEGHSLSDNRAESDELWLARIILKDRVQRHADNWDQATAIEREESLHLARIAIKNIPALCERIAARYINASKALRSMEEVSRAEREVSAENYHLLSRRPKHQPGEQSP